MKWRIKYIQCMPFNAIGILRTVIHRPETDDSYYRSDLGLKICFSMLKEEIHLIRSDSVASGGQKSHLIIRWSMSAHLSPKSNDSGHQIQKSKIGIGLSSCKHLTEQILGYTACYSSVRSIQQARSMF